MSFVEKCLAAVLLILYVVAQGIWFFHAVENNPQYDTQVVQFALGMMEAYLNGTLWDFFFALRKYPLLYVTETFLFFNTFLPDAGSLRIVHILARTVSMLHAFGTFCLVFLLSRRMHGHGIWAVLLLASSILTFQFSTAVRPHGVLPFYVLLTLYASLLFQEKPVLLRQILAFFSAVLAACVLQNGFLAFVFPVWASWVTRDGSRRHVFLSILLLLSCFFLALFVGYAHFFVGSESSLPLQNAMSLGHGYDVTPVPWLIVRNFYRIALSEPILLLFAAISIWKMYLTKTMRRFSGLDVMLIFMAVNYCIFTMISSSDGRTFILFHALFALIGAPALCQASAKVKMSVLLLLMLMLLRFAYLGSIQNSFQRLDAFMKKQNGASMVSAGPKYYDVPALSENQFVSYIIQPNYVASPEPTEWHRCVLVQASRFGNDLVLFWADTPFAFLQLFTTRRLGMNASVYCREPVERVVRL